MFKIDARAIVLAGIVTLAVVVLPQVTPHEVGLAALVSDGLGLAFLGMWTIGAMALAFMMPRLQTGFFGRIWRAPSSTYLLPRWMVQCCIGAMLGQAIGVSILAILTEQRLFWLAGSYSLVVGAFYAGAWRRLSQHPNTEFSMRWWRRI